MKKTTKWIIGAVILLVIVIVIILIALKAKSPQYSEINSSRPFKGNPQATVVIKEFSDFQCPACKIASSLVKSLITSYPDKIKIEFKYFPLVSIHTNAFGAALAAECANDQGKFWEMHDLMFANQEYLIKADLKKYASQITGMDVSSFDLCLDSKAKEKVVNEDIAEGESLGINGTPTFFLNGKEVENWRELENLILNAL